MIDYLIVGQGIAGSAFALQALKHQKTIAVIDEPDKNFSSRIAAGLFNPFTGPKSVKTWMADQLFPCVKKFYSEAEALTGGRFFSPLGLYKPFSSVHEQNEWMGKSADELYSDYVEYVTGQSNFGGALKDPFGGMMLKQTGYLHTARFLDKVREYIQAKGHIFNQRFSESDVVLGENDVCYREIRARYLILCQGISGAYAERFKKVPIRPLKGETLTIKTDWDKHVIVNRGVYMVPGNLPGHFRVGATYRFNDTSTNLTDEGRQELNQKLAEILAIPYEIIGQDWGVRPTTVDRKPILGHDPESDRVIIFNGLGTKGVSLAPYFSEVLFRWLENGEPLMKDITLTRFK